MVIPTAILSAVGSADCPGRLKTGPAGRSPGSLPERVKSQGVWGKIPNAKSSYNY